MDASRFRTLYDQTAKPLWAYLYRMTGDGVMAEELVQEAYFRLLQADDLPKNESALRTYLFKIGSRLVIDRRRRVARRRRLLQEHAPRETMTRPNPAAELDMESCFQELTERERSLLWLAHVDGYSHREIAEILSLKENSIKVLLYRARRKLAEVLERSGFKPAD